MIRPIRDQREAAVSTLEGPSAQRVDEVQLKELLGIAHVTDDEALVALDDLLSFEAFMQGSPPLPSEAATTAKFARLAHQARKLETELRLLSEYDLLYFREAFRAHNEASQPYIGTKFIQTLMAALNKLMIFEVSRQPSAPKGRTPDWRKRTTVQRCIAWFDAYSPHRVSASETSVFHRFVSAAFEVVGHGPTDVGRPLRWAVRHWRCNPTSVFYELPQDSSDETLI